MPKSATSGIIRHDAKKAVDDCADAMNTVSSVDLAK